MATISAHHPCHYQSIQCVRFLVVVVVIWTTLVASCLVRVRRLKISDPAATKRDIIPLHDDPSSGSTNNANVNDELFDEKAKQESLLRQHQDGGDRDETDQQYHRELVWDVFKYFKYWWLVPELFRRRPNPPLWSEAIVVGSGFGGSIAALRLGQAGIQTTVLERGQEWPVDPRRDIHTWEPGRDGRGLWHRRGVRTPIPLDKTPVLPVDYFGGVLDLTEYDNIEVWRGAAVGGGSKVYTGVTIQPDREYFEQIFTAAADSGTDFSPVGATVSWEEMNEIYYPRAKAMINASPMPDDIYDSDPFAHSVIWDEQARNAGYTIERPDSAFDWDIVRDELEGRSRPSATIGMSNMGNSNGVKYDLSQSYLKDARETGNVEVYPNQQVTDIHLIAESGRYRVDIQQLTPTGKIQDTYSIESKYLFLGAGSIGTSELLVKAKAKGTIGGLNDEIGKGWGPNGNLFMTRSFSPIDNFFQKQASPCASKIHDATGDLPITLESWYSIGVPVDVGVQASLGIVFDLDNNVGEFVYNVDDGTVDLIWPEDGNAAAIAEGRRVNDLIADSDPPSLPGVPLLGLGVWGGATGHPLGGAVLGKATNEYGKIRDGLFVVDGALIPGTTGSVNPSLTIAALAERNMDYIIANDILPSMNTEG